MRGPIYVMLTAAALLWSGNYVVGHSLVEVIPAITVTMLRWAIALVLFIPVAWFIEKPDVRAALAEWPRHLVLALAGPIGFNVLNYEALRFTTATNAAVVGAVNPAIIVLLAAVFLKQRMTWLRVAGIVVSLIGVMVVVTRGDILAIASVGFNLGELLQLGAVLAWAIYSLGLAGTRTPPITATTIQAAMAVIILLPFAIAAGGFTSAPTTATFLQLAYIGIFPTVAAYILWGAGVRRIGASRSGVFINIIPVGTAIIGLVFGEAIGLSLAAGGALVLIGVLLASGAIGSRTPTSTGLVDSRTPD